MRLSSFAVLLCLAAMPLAAQPAPEEVAAARLQYIQGDHAAALAVLTPAAEAGDPVAQNILGDAYDEGNGVPRDSAQALAWWEAAAEQDFDKALFNLARHHHMGGDAARAVPYYRRAVALDYPHAMNGLGMILEEGLAGEADPEAAADLYRRAAEHGLAEAMNNLARMHFYGEAVEEDLPRVLELYRQVAGLGDPSGLNNLGVMYDNGYAVTQDRYAALALYSLAAAEGHAQAAINLAYTLIEEDIGWTDLETGYLWCLRGMDRADAADLEGFREDCAYLAEVAGPKVVAAATARHAD